MDHKSISWVGSMYHGFESLCGRVEETMYQDTVKYVEDQMRTVGAGVKKFCSDVMQDLIPHSSVDTVEEEDTLLTRVHHANVQVSTKSKDLNEEKSMKTETGKMVNDSVDTAYSSNNVNYDSCCIATCSVSKPCETTFHDTVKEQCANKDFENHCAKLDLPILDSYTTKDLDNGEDCVCESPSDTSCIDTSLTKCCAEELCKSEVQNSSTGLVCGLANVIPKSASVEEVSYSETDGVGITEQMTEGNGSVGPLNGSRKVESTIGNSSPDFDGASKSLVACEIESGDADNKGFPLSAQLDNVKLGESCVLVEKSKHSSTTRLERKQKSYKKKIRDVFTPRRWSKSKEEQKQHAVWYEEQHDGKDLLPTSSKHLTIKDLQPYESFESEWELV